MTHDTSEYVREYEKVAREYMAEAGTGFQMDELHVRLESRFIQIMAPIEDEATQSYERYGDENAFNEYDEAEKAYDDFLEELQQELGQQFGEIELVVEDEPAFVNEYGETCYRAYLQVRE